MDLIVLKRHAVDVGRNPVYVIDFEGDTWVMVPKDHFDLLREDFDVVN